MFCPKCGASNRDGADTCLKCGRVLRTRIVAKDRNYANDPAMRMIMPVGRSGWAIAAGYAGLFAFLIAPAPIALILGIVAMFDLKRNPEKHGWGRAIFGALIGLLGTGLLLAVFLIP